MEALIWIGAGLTLIGLLGLIWCIVIAMRARKEGLDDAAMKAHHEGAMVDYTGSKLGEHVMPASWIGDPPLIQFIEALMHLFFLGIAESNFKLSNMFLVSTGRGENALRKSSYIEIAAGGAEA